ncbi:ABC transporter ATP-binding protein [Oceanidesulfovibrio marinus]|nr:ABC transporter ATP-binding protein [Oceanidesulfovibrio marinus]
MSRPSNILDNSTNRHVDTSMPDPMIRVEKLHCGYGRRAVLSDIDLEVGRGEMVGLLGPNGSGKTTLLLALSGVLAPESGRVLLDGDDVHAMPAKERARRIAAVPQHIEPSHDLTVREFVLMGRYPHLSFLARYGENDHAAAETAMRETGTMHLAERSAGGLSGGELQRTAIARAFAQCPQEDAVLLLDEAASGLDVAHKLHIHDLLRARHRAGATVVSAIHDLNLAALYCSRLVFLKEGHIVLDGPTAEVFTETHLTEIYGAKLTVFPHPVTGAPQCCLVPNND